MLTLKLNCDVPPERTVTVRLPPEVIPGRHELLVLVDAEPVALSAGPGPLTLEELAGTVTGFREVDAVAYQRAARDEWQ